jgi:hypothetical protein
MRSSPKVGLFVRLVAKAGKESEVASFLAAALPLAQDELDVLVVKLPV